MGQYLESCDDAQTELLDNIWFIRDIPSFSRNIYIYIDIHIDNIQYLILLICLPHHSLLSFVNQFITKWGLWERKHEI